MTLFPIWKSYTFLAIADFNGGEVKSATIFSCNIVVHILSLKEKILSQKEKLLSKLRALSKSFTFEEAEALLNYYSFKRSNKGKTSGSRVLFINSDSNTKILMHKPHPHKELKEYQMKQLIQLLESEGLI